MSTCRRETAPGAWDDARDPAFFRITASLFAPDACLGMSVLLASYDDEQVAPPTAPAAPRVLPVRPPLQPVRDRAA